MLRVDTKSKEVKPMIPRDRKGPIRVILRIQHGLLKYFITYLLQKISNLTSCLRARKYLSLFPFLNQKYVMWYLMKYLYNRNEVALPYKL